MIKSVFSIRYHRRAYLLDITLRNGRRIRHSFFKKSDADAALHKLKHDDVVRRYGLPVSEDRPFLSDLIGKRLEYYSGPERARAERVLNGLAAVLPSGLCVDEVTKAGIQKYVEQRFDDGLRGQSIDRELNIIGAMFNSVDLYFPSLEQWRPPKMPRPRILGGRRERLWTTDERDRVLTVLEAPGETMNVSNHT